MRRKNLFVSVLLNCFWPDGRINWKRTWREARYLAGYVSTLLLVLLLFFGICATPIVLVRYSIEFTPIVMDMGIDEITYMETKNNIGTTIQISSQPIAPFWKDSLWSTWHIWATIALYVVFSFYFVVLKLFIKLLNRYKKKVFRREEVYPSRD